VCVCVCLYTYLERRTNLLVNARAVRTPHISLLFLYTLDACYNSVRHKIYRLPLLRIPHSMKQKIIYGNLFIYILYICVYIYIYIHIYIYIIVTLLRELCIVSALCFTCKICLQIFKYYDENNKWTQMFKSTSTLHYIISILNLYVHVCVSLTSLIPLICFQAVLKIKMCFQPFAVSRPISEAKICRWNLKKPITFSWNSLKNSMQDLKHER
jgi:hypothetical protein